MRRAAILAGRPRWLDGIERVLAGLGVEVVAKPPDSAQMLAPVEEHEPDLLVLAPMSEDELCSLRPARERLPSLLVIAFVESAEGAATALAAGASMSILQPSAGIDATAIAASRRRDVSGRPSGWSG